MSWHYAQNGNQKGPVSEEEFAALRQNGVITDETLIWQQGMANWLAAGEVLGRKQGGAEAPPPPVARVDATSGGAVGVVCTNCGGSFSKDEVVKLGDGFVCGDCKPLVIQRMREGVGPSDAEEIRTEHIKHEASVKSVGILYLIGGSVILAIGLAAIAGSFLAPTPPDSRGLGQMVNLLIGVAVIAVSGLQIFVGLALRRLQPWSRVVASILSGIGLIGFPMGTLINGYILYLLLSQKGKMVFSPEYKEIIAQTPDVKYRTSIVVWIVLAILLFAMFAAIFAAVSG